MFGRPTERRVIYVDTSVIGGVFDEEFERDSRRLFEEVRQGRFTLLISDIVIEELRDAPSEVQTVLPSLPEEAVQAVSLTSEVDRLRDAYIDAGIVGPRWLDDAAHVAAATASRADALVSWNFRHIVHLDRIKGYNAVNLIHGYGVLTILTPREVIRFDEPADEEV